MKKGMSKKKPKMVMKTDLEDFKSDLKGRNTKPEQKYKEMKDSKGKKKGDAKEIRSK